MPETPLGLTYPEPGGHTRLWEHIQNLAEDADRLLDARVLTVDAGMALVAGTYELEFNNDDYVAVNIDISNVYTFGGTPVVIASGFNAFTQAYAQGRTPPEIRLGAWDFRGPYVGTKTVGWLAFGPAS